MPRYDGLWLPDEGKAPGGTKSPRFAKRKALPETMVELKRAAAGKRPGRPKPKAIKFPTNIPPGYALRVVAEALKFVRMADCLKANSGRHRYAGHPREAATCVHCGARRPEHRTCDFCRGFGPLVCMFCGGCRAGTKPEDAERFIEELLWNVAGRPKKAVKKKRKRRAKVKRAQ